MARREHGRARQGRCALGHDSTGPPPAGCSSRPASTPAIQSGKTLDQSTMQLIGKTSLQGGLATAQGGPRRPVAPPRKPPSAPPYRAARPGAFAPSQTRANGEAPVFSKPRRPAGSLAEQPTAPPATRTLAFRHACLSPVRRRQPHTTPAQQRLFSRLFSAPHTHTPAALRTSTRPPQPAA